MIINRLLSEKKISKYRLSKSSGVPQTTINDICSGKAQIDKCAAGTLYKIAQVLGVSVEQLLTAGDDIPSSFETYKSNICHFVKDMGDFDFIIDTLETNKIRKLYLQKSYPEAFYLLAMVDYLSSQNDLPLCADYDDIRRQKLSQPIYPSSVIAAAAMTGTDNPKKEALASAIPEFLRFNIVESEVRNVC